MHPKVESFHYNHQLIKWKTHQLKDQTEPQSTSKTHNLEFIKNRELNWAELTS
jgi:hypothetical protein